MKAYDAEALMKRPVPDDRNGLREAEEGKSAGFNYRLGWCSALAVVRDILKEEPTVEAVPLLPLCKLLAEIGGKPCFTQPGQEACDATLGDFKCCSMNDEAGCWEHLLRTWMDNGMEDYQ